MLQDNVESLNKKATEVRRLALLMSSTAGSGHPTSSLSATDVLTVLFDLYFRFDIKHPHNAYNDRLIFSKGHASPLFYALWAMAGIIERNDLKNYRTLISDLEGHPTPRLPFVDAATGSLGQGLSIGAGISLAATKDGRDIKTFVLLGDGEMAEGSVWEALNFAGYNDLSNLIAIVDVNRLAQSDPTMFEHNTNEYEKRISSFGWNTLVIDGHNFEEIKNAFDNALKSGHPTAIIAKTIKGKGVSFLEDKDNWHGKALKPEDLAKAFKEMKVTDGFSDYPAITFELKKPQQDKPLNSNKSIDTSNETMSFTEGEMIATRDVYGKALALLARENEAIFALDADVKNSTFSEDFKKEFPARFVECFIAEQNMVGVALGLSKQGKLPFVSTFSAFLTRAFDQIRMSRISMGNIKFCGSHAGVSIGEDGPSQMGLEDIAMFASIPDSVIFHPSDATSAVACIGLTANYDGISYLRTLRPKTPVLYDKEEKFELGGSKILRHSEDDSLVIVAAGITLHEALKAHEQLQKENINVTIVDAYSVKPIDAQGIHKAASSTKLKTIITVEDHYFHGGLGDMVLNAMASEDIKVHKLAVTEVSHSGKADELLEQAGISANSIIKTVKALL